MAARHAFKPQGRGLAIIIIGFVLLLSPVGRPVARFLRGVFQPIGTVLYRTGLTTSPFNQAASQDQLLRERAAKADMLELENSQLRRLLRFTKEHSHSTIGADVIGRSHSSLERVTHINKGAQEGIRPSQAVVAQGFLIGVIETVYEHTASVRLVTDPNFRLTVTVGKAGTPGIAKGSLGGLSVFRLLSNEQHSVGDTVSTSDIGKQVPVGLPVGIVRGIREAEALFREVDVESPVAIEQVQAVLVVIE